MDYKIILLIVWLIILALTQGIVDIVEAIGRSKRSDENDKKEKKK